MRARICGLGFTILSVFTVSACGGSGGGATSPSGSVAGASAPTAQSSSATIGVRTGNIGQYLVDTHGITLYLFLADTGTSARCYSGCASDWPPLLVSGTPTVTGGASASLVGTTLRTDGTVQVTYGGHPLYYYMNDTAPGLTGGEGVNSWGADWDLVSPSGDKLEKPGS
jgi:predicted lipoprotein with Yx(FWY)xxD motif